MLEWGELDRGIGRSGHRGCSATKPPDVAVAGTEGKWQRRQSVKPSALFRGSHIRMLPEKRSKGNLDPSRLLAPVGADTAVAGRDGPAVLPGSAGDGGWHSAVAELGLRRGKPGCNSTVRDHNAGRSRTPLGIGCRGRPFDGESLRHEPPYPPEGGLDNGNRIMAG